MTAVETLWRVTALVSTTNGHIRRVTTVRARMPSDAYDKGKKKINELYAPQFFQILETEKALNGK